MQPSRMRPAAHDLVGVVLHNLGIGLVIRAEFTKAARKPLPDAPLGLDRVEWLHPEPGDPFLARLRLVAFAASGDAVAGAVFTACALGSYVVNCEAVVVDRRATTVGAAVVPGVFDALPPLLAGFSSGEGSHVE